MDLRKELFMKIIDVTNNHFDLVNNQLENTDAYHVKVYSIGGTTVIHTQAATHQNIILVNRVRKIHDREIDFTIEFLFNLTSRDNLEILYGHNFVEIEAKV